LTNNTYEIPQQLREIAEKNVHAAQSAYGQMMDAMTQAMTMWSSSMPANEMTAGFKAVQERAAQIAKQNADAAFALGNNIAHAQNVQEVISLQSQYAQSQMQAFAAQAQEMSQLVIGMATGRKSM
jgi:hypothetical protein